MKWLVALRFLLAGVCAVDVVLADHREGPPAPALVLLAGVLALNLAYLALLGAGRPRDRRRFAAAQVAADVFLVSALVYLTGGVRSDFLPLYFASVLSAAILVSPRAGVLLASLSTTLLALVTIAYSLAAARYGPELPLVAPELLTDVPREMDRILAFLVAYGVSLHLVAALVGALVARSTRVRILTEEILAHIGEGLLVVDARGETVHMNERARALLGLPPGPPTVGQALADVLGREGDGVHEVELPLPGGGRRPLEVRVSHIPDPAGRARGRIAVLADLTDRRRVVGADRALARLEAIRELASGIAHEIRNPLASIRGCAQELARSSRASETDRRLAGILCRESDRLDRIVEEFLRFSRLRPLRPRPADLSRLAADVALLLRSRDDARGVEVVLEAPGEAPCTCDPEQLTQVLLNLGVNGLQAMGGKGRLTLRVEAAARLDGRTDHGGWELHVLDQGPGVPPGERERIFTPFYTTRPEGTGLGLSFVSRIVDAHGGRVEVGEAPGGGAAFGVWLPRRGVVPEAPCG